MKRLVRGHCCSRYALLDLANMNASAYSHVTIEQNTYMTQGQRYGFYASGTSFDSNISTSSGEKLFTVTANTAVGNNIIANTTYRVNGIAATLSNRSGGGGTYHNHTGLNGYVIGGFNNGSNSSQSVGLGLVGSVYEVVVYNSALTTTQRQAVESYLNSKWAIY